MPNFSSNRPEASREVLLDAHVHLYDCFDAAAWFASAQVNFRHFAQQLGVSESAANCVFVVDLQDKNVSCDRNRLSSIPGCEFTSAHPDEPDSGTIVDLQTGFELQIIWGYQIISAENLEVLAFNPPCSIPNGVPLEQVLASLDTAEAFAILPWGFGKWWGGRGRHIARVLDTYSDREAGELALLVGDNGGRLNVSPCPKLLTNAIEKQIWNIPGSDPLPFPSQHNKPGSRGAVLCGNYEESRPLESINALIRKLTQQPKTYGSGERFLEFLFAQWGMQKRKRL